MTFNLCQKTHYVNNFLKFGKSILMINTIKSLFQFIIIETKRLKYRNHVYSLITYPLNDCIYLTNATICFFFASNLLYLLYID